MQRRPLGSTGLLVSEIGLGAWQLGNRTDWAVMDNATALRLVGEALDGGINLFDTAPNYGSTRSEELLGRGLAGRRRETILVSKFGHRPDDTPDFTVQWFWESLEGSLQRLRTDYLDVLLLHNPDVELYRGTDPLWEALEAARSQGKIRHYGASLDFAVEAEACLENTRSEVLEVLFNILHQDVRRAFPLARERGAGILAKVPLDSGWLTGRFDATTRFEGVRRRWTLEDVARRAELVAQLDWLTADGSPLAHKAVEYILAYDEISCVIPGIRTPEQLRIHLEAGRALLSRADRERLEAFWDDFTGRGANLLPW